MHAHNQGLVPVSEVFEVAHHTVAGTKDARLRLRRCLPLVASGPHAAGGHVLLDEPLIRVLERVCAVRVHAHDQGLVPVAKALEVPKHAVARLECWQAWRRAWRTQAWRRIRRRSWWPQARRRCRRRSKPRRRTGRRRRSGPHAAGGHVLLDEPLVCVLECVCAVCMHTHDQGLVPVAKALEVPKHAVARLKL